MAVVLALLLASDGATTQARDRVWSVDGAVRIGSANDLDQALTAVGQVVILPNGDLAVGQPQDHTVLVFNSQGRRIRAIGRKGEGLGEFKVLSGIGLLRDTLYASDDALRRVSYFTPDGRFTRSVIWHSLPGRRQDVIYGLRAPQILLPDGSALLEPFSLGVPFPEYELYSLLPDGGGVVVVKRPLARGRGAAAFHVRKIGPSGDTAFSRSYAYTPKPLRPSDVTGIARALHERFQKRRENPAYRDVPPPGVREFESALRDYGVPAALVPITDLASGQDRTIWLKREALSDTPATWQVLGLGGDVIGTIALPGDQRIVAARGDVLVVLEQDSLDVPYLVRYRLRR